MRLLACCQKTNRTVLYSTQLSGSRTCVEVGGASQQGGRQTKAVRRPAEWSRGRMAGQLPDKRRCIEWQKLNAFQEGRLELPLAMKGRNLTLH